MRLALRSHIWSYVVTVCALLADADPSDGTRVRGAGCWIGAMAIFAIASSACTEQAQHRATRTLTATVTLSLEDTLAIDSAVTLSISGEKRIDQIFATLEAVVTASTSSRAEDLASRLAIEVQRRDRTVAISIPLLKDSILQGSLKLRVPSDLKIDVIERGDTTDIIGMDEDLRVASLSTVRITGAQRNVTVGVVRGNVQVDLLLDPGAAIELVTENGDVELRIPPAVSADISALVKSQGTIVPDHPQLPPYRGQPGQVYRVRIGDGLSAVSLQSGVGNIAIRTR
jgi:hypothetical protein